MARQSKAIQQQSLEGPRLTGCVTRTHGRHHYVTTVDGNVYEAHRRGKKSDVVVGDIVICSQPSGGVVAIESIEPRTNLLYRSDEWRIKELASNLTLVACVFASRPTFNPKFVWKAIVAAQAADIPVLVIRNKSDLSDKAQEAEAFLAQCFCVERPRGDAQSSFGNLRRGTCSSDGAVRHGQEHHSQRALPRGSGPHAGVFRGA